MRSISFPEYATLMQAVDDEYRVSCFSANMTTVQLDVFFNKGKVFATVTQADGEFIDEGSFERSTLFENAKDALAHYQALFIEMTTGIDNE